MKLIAAMSGGVDSAVAAARAVEAGHEVIGVHLALSANPQKYRSGARGCCTIEDSHDARRAADVIGIPFYIWDMAEEFHDGVVEDFLAEYAQGRTPNPCLRCNEKIKFAAVLDRARAMGFDGVVTGHYARTQITPEGKTLHRAYPIAAFAASCASQKQQPPAVQHPAPSPQPAPPSTPQPRAPSPHLTAVDGFWCAPRRHQYGGQ